MDYTFDYDIDVPGKGLVKKSMTVRGENQDLAFNYAIGVIGEENPIDTVLVEMRIVTISESD